MKLPPFRRVLRGYERRRGKFEPAAFTVIADIDAYQRLVQQHYRMLDLDAMHEAMWVVVQLETRRKKLTAMIDRTSTAGDAL